MSVLSRHQGFPAMARAVGGALLARELVPSLTALLQDPETEVNTAIKTAAIPSALISES